MYYFCRSNTILSSTKCDGYRADVLVMSNCVTNKIINAQESMKIRAINCSPDTYEKKLSCAIICPDKGGLSSWKSGGGSQDSQLYGCSHSERMCENVITMKSISCDVTITKSWDPTGQ